jgi:hypothetical protein
MTQQSWYSAIEAVVLLAGVTAALTLLCHLLVTAYDFVADWLTELVKIDDLHDLDDDYEDAS